MDLCATWTLPTIMGSRRCRARSAVTGTPRPSSRETGRPGTKGLGTAKANSDGSITVSAWRYGPLTTMMPALLSSARSGGLDGALLTSKQFYQTDCTKPLLLLAGRRPAVRPCPGRAPARRAVGHDERDGRLPRPGIWLWLYTFWYQIKPISTSADADVPGNGGHGGAGPRDDPGPVHSRGARRPAPDSDLQTDVARALPGVCRLIESPAFRRRSPRQRARIRTMLHRRIRDPRRWVERRAARCSLSSCSLTSAAT